MTEGQSRREYLYRINKVIDYIEENLSRDLSLEELAGVANFSRFHFHRIFTAMTGESLYRFIQRLRVEKSATMLIARPDDPITTIALECGFGSSAAFARVFKTYFRQSASEWRLNKVEQEKSKDREALSKFSELKSNMSQAVDSVKKYIDHNNYYPIWRYFMINKNEIKVEVVELPAKHVAYVRYIGPYSGNEAIFEGLFQKLHAWAGPRGLLRFPETECFSIYHDDPCITEESKLRTSVCLTVPQDTPVEGEIGKMTLSAGLYARGHFEIHPHEYQEAWDFMTREWLPESGYQPADGNCFEWYKNDPATHPEKKHLVAICIPVKPL